MTEDPYPPGPLSPIGERGRKRRVATFSLYSHIIKGEEEKQKYLQPLFIIGETGEEEKNSYFKKVPYPLR
jgi:hypothetical protein